ncbi:hypothetical protein CRM71_09500 [Prevotella jejuni]|nr:hypothetical protein CRM71_09500 [Prevotella jejuni]
MDRQKMLGYFAYNFSLHSERAQRWDKKRPFFTREHALLADRRRPSWSKKGVFFNAIHNILIY